MALEEKSSENGDELWAQENDSTVLPIAESCKADNKNTLGTLKLESGPILQVTQNECKNDVQNSTSANMTGRINSFSKKCLDLFPTCSGQGQQLTSNRLNVLSAFTTLACVILLCLYIVRSRSLDLQQSNPTSSDTDQVHFRSLNVNSPFAVDGSSSKFTWSNIQSIFEQNAGKSRLHITVSSEGNFHPKLQQQRPTLETHESTLKIWGRPSYCVASDRQTPESVVAKYTTHLHISEMGNCHHYAKLILTRWKFPKIHHIKLHKMLIREQEFQALTKFIDRHNETLHKVEIDECFLCPSPICDAGLLNFPEHDFQITITRRRESADWI